jgi:oligopeptide/dipeptide ABC transporter ATP-binding protein
MLLEVTDLHVRFRWAGALRARLAGIANSFVDAVLDVDLAIARGETLALVGESGSGKTTLGRAILGLIRIHAGRIALDGQNLTTKADLRRVRRDLAMMFQDPVSSLSPRKTIRTLLAEPFRVHGVAVDIDAELHRLLGLVGLDARFLRAYPHQLSGGQARRIGVARALALAPKLVIADEPTAGLDVSVQGEVLNLMTRLGREMGVGYLIITHNLPVIRHISDRVAIMYMGRIIEAGPTEALLAAPAHPYTRALLAAVPHPGAGQAAMAAVLQGEVPSLRHRPQGCDFQTRCPLVHARCRAQAPPSEAIGAGRMVRCHTPSV